MKILLYVLFIFINILMMSCAPTYEYFYASPNYIKTTIKPGDKVKITTRDKKEHEFEVVEIREDTIAGQEITLRFEDIEKYGTVFESSGKKTAKTLGVIVVGVPLLILSTGF